MKWKFKKVHGPIDHFTLSDYVHVCWREILKTEPMQTHKKKMATQMGYLIKKKRYK